MHYLNDEEALSICWQKHMFRDSDTNSIDFESAFVGFKIPHLLIIDYQTHSSHKICFAYVHILKCIHIYHADC